MSSTQNQTLTSRMYIRVHGWPKRAFTKGISQRDTFDSDSFRLKKGGTFDGHTMDDNGEPWLSETEHRTGWNKEFKSGTYRGMLYGIFLRDYPKQVVSLVKAKSVPANMREFLSWAQRHYCIDVTASTVERKTGEPTSAGPYPGGCKDFTHKGPNACFIRMTCNSCGTVRSEDVIRHDKTLLYVFIATRSTGEAMHTRERQCCVDCGTYIDSVPREQVEHHRTVMKKELADRVLNDTTITKRQLDLATRLMLWRL